MSTVACGPKGLIVLFFLQFLRSTSRMLLGKQKTRIIKNRGVRGSRIECNTLWTATKSQTVEVDSTKKHAVGVFIYDAACEINEECSCDADLAKRPLLVVHGNPVRCSKALFSSLDRK